MIKLSKLLCLSTVLLYSSYATSNDCSPINNLDQTVSLSNTRNQGDIGWCYAYAAADLIGKKISEELSPRDIASSYNNEGFDHLFNLITNTKEYEIEGGFIHTAMRRAVKRGLCEYSRVPDANDGAIAGRMKKLYDIYQAVHKAFPNGANASKIASFIEDNNLITNDIANFFPELTSLDFAKIISAEKENTFYDKLIDASCYGFRIEPADKIRYRNHDKLASFFNDSFLAKMDSYLEQGKIVGISYFASVLYAPTDKLDGRHASSVVARKLNSETNKCEYLVRNSWGRGCYSYPKEFKCENGHIWIPGDLLKNAIYKMTIVRD